MRPTCSSAFQNFCGSRTSSSLVASFCVFWLALSLKAFWLTLHSIVTLSFPQLWNCNDFESDHQLIDLRHPECCFVYDLPSPSRKRWPLNFHSGIPPAIFSSWVCVLYPVTFVWELPPAVIISLAVYYSVTAGGLFLFRKIQSWPWAGHDSTHL